MWTKNKLIPIAQEAKNIGGKQLLKGATALFIISELIVLLIATWGDFANGILFFIDAQTKPIFFFLIILYFTIMFLFGRLAGFEILTKKRKYNLVGLLCGLFSTLIMISLIALVMILLKSHDFNIEPKEVMLISIRNFFILLIPMLLTWFWSVRQIKLKEIV